MATNITTAHKDLVSASNSGEYDNFALVSTTFDGEPTAAVATVTQEEDGMFLVTPVAILVTDSMFHRLTSPDDSAAA